MTKSEIASLLGVSTEDVYRWAQPSTFADWLDVCPLRTDRLHDQDDVLIFTLISEINQQIEGDVTFVQRVELIKRRLWTSDRAVRIRLKRKMERERPEVARWQIVATAGVCLRYDYEWLGPLQPFVVNIADFGCWASDVMAGTCSEPYALLWTLEAAKVVVIDKEPVYIRNAQEWLNITREKHPYFKEYNLKFAVGDMTDKRMIERIDALDEGVFDLSYCHNVLYNMHPHPNELRDSIDTMVRVVKPGGWVIAVEPKMGVQYEERPGVLLPVPVPLNEPENISEHFEAAGLIEFSLDGAPDHSYCYQKPEIQ